MSAGCCLLLQTLHIRVSPWGLRYGALNLPRTLRFLTVTLCLHFTLSDNLSFTTVFEGGEPPVVSKGLEESDVILCFKTLPPYA